MSSKVEELSLNSHSHINKKMYVFRQDEDGHINGVAYNYENSKELEEMAIDTPNGKIYPFRVNLNEINQ